MKDTIKAGLLVAVCAAGLFIGMYITNTWLLPRLIATQPAPIEQPAPPADPFTPEERRARIEARRAEIMQQRAAAAEQARDARAIYSWKDARGEWHITDTPPPPTATNVTIRQAR